MDPRDEFDGDEGDSNSASLNRIQSAPKKQEILVERTVITDALIRNAVYKVKQHHITQHRFVSQFE